VSEAHATAACRNHPKREAIGICVECRGRICSECVTKVDGINYCVSCLAELAERDRARSETATRPSSPVVRTLAAGALFTVTTLLTWVLLIGTLPGG
jgi:hypothetical protein